MAFSEPSPVPGDEVHVWRARLDYGEWAGAGGLPAAERARAAGMLRPQARRRWVAARWALRGVLARYLEREPAEIELRLGGRGKPMLAPRGASLRFNLSHSGELALVAVVRNREVGVDVQRIGSRWPARFYLDWTRREAVAKCHGAGLWAPLPDAPVAVSSLNAEPGFAASLAVSGAKLPAVRQFVAEPGERCCY
jgi:phosphopantetheinyl transferase